MKHLTNLSLLSFLSVFLNGDTLQVFSEEMNNTTVRCPPFTSDELEMYLVFKSGENKVFLCKNNTLPCVSGTGAAIFNNSGSYFPVYIPNITIKRSMRAVRCIYKTGYTQTNYTEELSCIAKAEGVKCYDTQLTNNNQNISVTCMTSKIYPEAHCDFSVYGHVSYQHFQYSNTVDYYQSNCTWTSSLNNFQVGNNTLDVSFYPNVTNDTIFATTLRLSFQFFLPNILLSNECLNGPDIVQGYIKPGATAICVCYLNNSGYPPASLKWTNSSDLNLGTFLNNSATSLTIEPFNSKETYNCKLSTNLLNGELSIPYKVNYAKGPTSCSIELNNTSPTTWKMCKNTIINWTIICQVNQTDAIPGIKAKISVNSQYSNLLDSQNFNNLYQVRNEITVTEAGDYFIGCQAQNLYFPDVNAACSYTPLHVIAPPILSPIIQIQSADHDTVVENKEYYLECSAYGGKPNVTNLTLSCGNIEFTQSGNILNTPVIFTRTMTGQNCTCTAQHITGCYENNTSTLKLKILYSAAVVNLNVTSSVIEKGNYAQIFCEADGNPAPNISIVKGNEIIAQNSSGYILFLNKSMDCKDGGNYICQANNGIDLNRYNKQVNLFVRCPLQFSSDDIFKNFSLQEGNTFFYNFTIYGYPDPDNFTISKFNQGRNNVEVKKSSLETPYLSIELKISRLTHTDFDNYTLFIFQNGSQPLLFNFSISKEMCNSTRTTTPLTTTSTTRGTTTRTTTATTRGTTSQHFTTELPATATGQSGNVRHDFICHFATMEIFIPVSEAPNAVLRLRDPSCVLVNNGTHHVITFPFDKCGTSVTSFTDYSIVTNYVTVHTNLQVSAPVVFGDDYNINLECQVPQHMVLDGSFQAVTKEPVQQVNGNTQLGFHLREYTSADYSQEITKYPVQVSINKEIFLEVTLADETSRNTTLGVKVNECRATPSSDPRDPTSYLLIRDSCPATPAVHLQSSSSPETFRFSVQTFHFSGNTNTDDVVYIHCDVSTCHADTCGFRCGASGGARRKRRSGISKRSALGSTLTSGPHIIVN